MTDSRRISFRAAAALVLGLALAPTISSAGIGTFDDIWRQELQNCNSCHGPLGGTQSGGMIASDDGFGSTEAGWYGVLVGKRPANAAAAALGKLRVTPYEPENSFLLDKLRGHLKKGEGRPMPFGSNGRSHLCPGLIDKVTKWILNGAQRSLVTFDPNDTSPGVVDCDALVQPDFSAPPAGGATQLLGDLLTVTSPANGHDEVYEGEIITTRTLSADLLVGRIEVVASAGTEYVVVSRGDVDANGNEVPLAVARGTSLDVHLPAGVAVPLTAGQTITIRQRIRNDYWVGSLADGYVNTTTGNVAVNLYPATSPMVHEAKPFLDATGTQLLFAPPRGLGESGGAWTASGPVNGAVVGVWGDRRLIEAALVDPASQGLAYREEAAGLGDRALTGGYVALGESGLPANLIAYQCTHSNGFTNLENNTAQYLNTLSLLPTTSRVNRPMKFACLETAQPQASIPPVPPGSPAILGRATPISCAKSIHDPAQSAPYGPPYEDSDCGPSSGAAVDSCVPADLVGGDGVNDGRCTLIGLVW